MRRFVVLLAASLAIALLTSGAVVLVGCSASVPAAQITTAQTSTPQENVPAPASITRDSGPTTPPEAPTSVAAYSTTDQELEVRWSSSDFATTTSFKVQWKSGTQDYDTSRQALSDPATSTVPASSSETSRRYKHTITGLTDGPNTRYG